MSSKVSPNWPISSSPVMPVRAVRSPERICAAVEVIDLMGLASLRDTSTPMRQARKTATRPAVMTAPYELVRKAASPFVSRASLPNAHRRTVPTCVPSASVISWGTTESASVGASEASVPPAEAVSASVCSPGRFHVSS